MMQHPPATEPDNPYPALLAARSAVLLPVSTNRPERASLVVLANSLQTQLGGLVRVLCSDEDTHFDVVRSFAIIRIPAFVLVRRGVELWRQESLIDEETLVELIKNLLTA